MLALTAFITLVVILVLPTPNSWLEWLLIGVLGICGGVIGLWIDLEWRERRRSDLD